MVVYVEHNLRPQAKPIEYEISGSGCWEVTSHPIDEWGYIRLKRDGRSIRAHRHVYALEHDVIPPDMVIRHMCDNPLCINPDHLEVGTHQDNMDDRQSRGRWRGNSQRGSDNPASKLTESDVLDIYNSDSKHVELARLYGVSKHMIGYIKSGRKWGWLTNAGKR